MSALALSQMPAVETPKADSLTCAVVDDSLIDRYLICHALKEVFDDSVTIEFATATEARRYFEAGIVDVILADRILPDGDGADFALSPPEGAAVLLLSGEDCGDIADRIGATGRSRFLHKDDLSGARLAEELAVLLKARKEAGSEQQSASRPSEPGHTLSPVTRGLRLLRTVRASKDRAGQPEMAELLTEVERILIELKPREH